MAGLRRINPLLYSPSDTVYNYLVKGTGQTGLYLGDPANTTQKRKLLLTFPAGVVPEFTQIDAHGRVMARGWRSLFQKLYHAGIVGYNAIQLEFGVNLDIGERDKACKQCMRGGQTVKSDGSASGLCTDHEMARLTVAHVDRVREESAYQ